MATQPISSFSGLASGIQWRDMVDQIIALEEQRRLTPVTNRVTLENARKDAWGKYSGLLSKLSTAAGSLRTGTAFGAFSTSVANSPTTSRALVSATTSASAAAGVHEVEVLQLATNEKLSGAVQTTSTASLNIAGDFVVNGKRVEIVATDSLSSIRTKINATNTGTAPSGVTASILTTGTSQHRLVLTSDHAGSGGIELVDGTAGALSQLGFLDGTTTANATGDGGTQTQRFSSTTTAIATMLGVPLPSPSTIKVGGQAITVDLSVDSLSSILAKIQAAGGSAETVSETVGGNTTYRLKVGGSVTADAGAAVPADSQRTLELLGFAVGGRSSVAQQVRTENTLTDAGGVAATAATLLTDLGTNGSAGAVAASDTFTITGTRGDGTTVSITHTVQPGDTVQSLLDTLNDPATGFGSGARPATASLVGGQIRLTDSQAGDSVLSLSIVANNEGGGSLNFGRANTETVGRKREIASGTDAQFRLDGVTITRPTNTVTDTLSGVTLNLLAAEVGTTVELTIARNLDAIVNSMKEMANAYNAVVAFQEQQRSPGAALYANGTLRAVGSSLTNTLLTEVSGLGTTSYKRAAVAGVALTKTGQLEVDATVLKDALTTNFEEVMSLFSTRGAPSDGEVTYITGSSATQAGSYAVDITAVATRASLTGAGFSGTYVDDGTADTFSFTDTFTGRTGSIQLSNGDTIDEIVARLNDLFGTEGMRLEASKSGNELVITGSEYGTAAGFTLAYTGGGADGTAQLGLAAGTYAGTDVQGTIGGVAATGAGQVLTGGTGQVTEGLTVRYTGSVARAAGTVGYTLGVAGMIDRMLDPVTRAGDGAITLQTENIGRSIDSLTRRASDIQNQLDTRYESLVNQFTRMEAALSKIQSQGSWLAAQLGALPSNSNNQ